MRNLRFFVGVWVLLAGTWSQVQAGYVGVSLNAYTNQDFRQNPYQTVSSLPVGGSALIVGNTPFTLATDNGQAGTTGIVQVGGLNSGVNDPTTLDIAVNIAGAVEVDTLINSVYGGLNQMSGQVQFFGTNGAFASFNLVQGLNIRDYNIGSVFNNTIASETNTITYTSSTPTAGGTYGTRLDEQTFVLPTSFLGQTLTDIRLINSSSFQLSGEPFLAAATVLVPEPGSLILSGIAALIGLGQSYRNRQK